MIDVHFLNKLFTIYALSNSIPARPEFISNVNLETFSHPSYTPEKIIALLGIMSTKLLTIALQFLNVFIAIFNAFVVETLFDGSFVTLRQFSNVSINSTSCKFVASKLDVISVTFLEFLNVLFISRIAEVIVKITCANELLSLKVLSNILALYVDTRARAYTASLIIPANVFLKSYASPKYKSDTNDGGILLLKNMPFTP